jgi:hypothetical protein
VSNQLKADALNQKTVPAERFMQTNRSPDVKMGPWLSSCHETCFWRLGSAQSVTDKMRE